MRLWDLSSGQCLHTLTGHTNWVNSVALSVDGRLALSGAEDNTVRVWDLAAGRTVAVFHHSRPVTAVALARQERIVVVGDDLGNVLFFRLESPTC
jgi:WD40 repeat protein